MTITVELVLTNLVPAVAVKRGGRALFIIIGRKGTQTVYGLFILKDLGLTQV